MKGEECATLSKPPNHKLFDHQPLPVSPVLQCRLENARSVTANVPSAPVFNISIGKDFVDLLRPPTVPQVAPAAPMLLPAHVPILDYDMSNLLSRSHVPGVMHQSLAAQNPRIPTGNPRRNTEPTPENEMQNRAPNFRLWVEEECGRTF
jgi:hypothetical protein